MRAIRYRRFGGPEVLQSCDVPTPIPKRNQVRIRVHATTVTAAESAMRQGQPRWGRVIIGFTAPRRRFQILGNELAGHVDAVGADVTRFAPGDAVFGFAGFNIGANAEYICLPQHASLAPKPTKSSFEECVAAVDGASTALHFLRDLAGIARGQRVAVVGASGSIGTYAVQLAKRFGAHVTGVCSTANVALVQTLGADAVVDYTQDDITEHDDAYDIIFDTVGATSFRACKSALRAGGIYLPTVITPGNVVQRLFTPLLGRRRVVGGMSVEKNAALRFIGELLDARDLQVIVERQYALEAIADAHRHVDTGRKRGNVVVTVS